MKIVILAAGKGSRLGGKEIPKPLTLLSNGMSILQYQLSQLAKHFSLHDLYIVVGYHKELIMQAFPEACYVYNPRFADENTSKSLLRALKKIDDDVLWLNGDVVFHPSVLKKIGISLNNAMLVNICDVGEEEVAYRTDGRGKILKVAKKLVTPEGEALGINFFKRDSLEILREQLELCQSNDYFEKAIEMSISKGLEVWTLPVQKEECTEIDFPEDLERANLLIQKWEKH
ncbi:MAG: phosphocholine cytidylyltransferase family protein [Parachlamydiaceae bacterium]|nr:phosphocholine cytidylyltransferase family protein [Parachlamydiaceae bacterium]